MRPQDYREAFQLFQEAAGLGHAPAMYYCGVAFLYGQGVPQVDYNQALMWFDQVKPIASTRRKRETSPRK